MPQLELRLRSADPTAAPIIDPRYLSAPEDLEHLVIGARLTREIAATGPLAGLLGAEVWPGAEHDSAEALRAYVRRNLGTTYHVSGTCRMGVDPDAGAPTRGCRRARSGSAGPDRECARAPGLASEATARLWHRSRS